MTAPVLPGAEPWSAPGGPHGALVLHGFTGCPQSMRGLAQALAAAGFAVELPLLPGHGTAVDVLSSEGESCLLRNQQALRKRPFVIHPLLPAAKARGHAGSQQHRCRMIFEQKASEERVPA